MIQGLLDGLDGTGALEPEQFIPLMQRLGEQARNDRIEKEGGANKADGEAYLAENGAREGVVTTESGLQYEVLEEGAGPHPSATDQVRVHYHGTLIDGTVFDSSVERDESITFRLDGVIAGWTEGLQLMPVGSKYRFVIPSGLGYGEGGSGDIGPNSALIFEVELIGIE
jgi:FKBP-type peptidyl-prolyl cis-trans isomerase